DRPAVFGRAFYVQGTPAADISNFAITGLFGQAKWDLSSRFNLTAGARLDLVDSSSRPPLNSLLVSTFGVRNDGTVDGTQIVSPRLGANWALDEARMTQVRGGIGYFTGRAPWVFISNSFSNSGVGRFNVLETTGARSLASYLRNTFDPANPIGVAA